MNQLKIHEVKTSWELRKFIKYPLNLYENNSYYVPPLIIDEINTLTSKNPALKFCDKKLWYVTKNDKIVGRIAGIINHRFIERWNNKLARFGWVDFEDDEGVVNLLFDTAENWARKNGMIGIHGPLGFTDLDREGLLVEGFNEKGTYATIYNYPYYPKHLEKLGYKKDIDWVEYRIKVPKEIPEKAVRIAEIVKKRLDIHVPEFKNSKELLPYASEIFDVINETYHDLYGFVPLDEEQVKSYTKQYFPFVSPKFLKIILEKNYRVVGFVIAMPSLTDAMQKAKGRLFPFGWFYILRALKQNKYLDLYLGAVRKEYQGKGADAFLITELTKSCIQYKIEEAESNPELETNYAVQGHWKNFEARLHKIRRCYIKYFDS